MYSVLLLWNKTILLSKFTPFFIFYGFWQNYVLHLNLPSSWLTRVGYWKVIYRSLAGWVGRDYTERLVRPSTLRMSISEQHEQEHQIPDLNLREVPRVSTSIWLLCLYLLLGLSRHKGLAKLLSKWCPFLIHSIMMRW